MKAGRETADFAFDVLHIGMDMDFHHPRGRDLKLAAEVVDAFEHAREHAEIFVQNSSGTAFSADELLDWFLLQSQTTIADHLPPATLEKAEEPGGGDVFVTFPIRFQPDAFHMRTEDGPQDLSALKLMARVTIRRKSQ
ncbi:MAG: hypothetical protein HQL36_11975 [Alphaproteobacteria bacterium]|nr:hypothetical protein [Alphaproteobacteria bacterium]